MTKKVSESVTGQNRPKPSRQERDEAFSSGAGRKAVEVPVADKLHANDRRERVHTFSAPVGTELETKARELDD